jgi:hypothetical protein
VSLTISLKKRENNPNERKFRLLGAGRGYCMKKTVLLSAFVFGSFLLASCAGVKTFDVSVPEEKTAEVRFVGTLVPTSYNGIPVKKFNWVKLPEGRAEFVINVYGGLNFRNGYRYSGEDMVFSINLEGGKTYGIEFHVQEKYYGVMVYDVMIPAVGRPSDDHIIGFIPFDDNDTIFMSASRSSYY